MTLPGLLKTIVGNPTVHAKWLNTLSYLEHIGSRKIIKSQDSTTLDERLLSHIAEEARHAHFFKRLSLKLKPDYCISYAPDYLLAGEAATTYLQELDHQIAASLNTEFKETVSPRLTYFYVSHTIETRALTLFTTYKETLDEVAINLPIQTVIHDEHGHLSDMLSGIRSLDPHYAIRLRRFDELEARLFASWQNALAELVSGNHETVFAAAI